VDHSAPPRPAATVLAVRDAADGFEVLMVRRNLRSDFVGGAYVFPGGAVDPTDADLARVVGPDDAALSAQLGLAGGGRAYFVAALRELFEEAGVLVACDDAGRPVTFDDSTSERLVAVRGELNDGHGILNELLAREGLWLDLRGLAYLAHWVTPVGPPRRFDTRFFALVAPAGQHAMHDDAETVATVWIRPRDALTAQTRGEYEMIFPTIRTLESVADLEHAADVVSFARSQVSVTAVEPRIVERDGAIVVVLPGEDGYDA
jgi:8-oxo-dGTP pyrophosphatase MutT (NUDIX family)